MRGLGTHILIDMRSCDQSVLNDVPAIRAAMLEAAEAAGATILSEHFHAFSPIGVSGAVIIAESHLSIHTWPEYRFAAVDIFTCGDTLQPDRAVAVLVGRLRCESPGVVEVRRGILSTDGAPLPHKITA